MRNIRAKARTSSVHCNFAMEASRRNSPGGQSKPSVCRRREVDGSTGVRDFASGTIFESINLMQNMTAVTTSGQRIVLCVQYWLCIVVCVNTLTLQGILFVFDCIFGKPQLIAREDGQATVIDPGNDAQTTSQQNNSGGRFVPCFEGKFCVTSNRCNLMKMVGWTNTLVNIYN